MALQNRATAPSCAHELVNSTSEGINQSLDVSVKVSRQRVFWRLMAALCVCLTPAPGRAYEVSPVDERSRLGSTTPGKRKTLVLDLDETLVHSSLDAIPDPDYFFTVEMPEGRVPIYAIQRPGLQEFLERAKKNYDILIYTASLKEYANSLLDLLDYKQLIDGRYFREDCLVVDGVYIKDLDRLGRELSTMVIVDVSATQNSPSAYQNHKANAVPISSFINDRSDLELYKLADLLEEIAEMEDVRPALAKLARHSSTLREESVQLLLEKRSSVS